jgi:4'-phosphopantetheinyl transferase
MKSVFLGFSDSAGSDVWQPPPEPLQLSADQVHVWRVSLEASPETLASLWQTLSTDEQERANRYQFARDRQAYIARRGRLRLILGCYLGLDPASLRFSYNPFGKPTLQLQVAGQLSFNLSHSQGLALYAFARQADIGVDIEHLRSDVDHLALAEHFFSTAERAELDALPMEIRQQAFFLCWTRKEAFIKAHGEGLSLPLDHFDVSLTPGLPARLLATRAGLEHADQWSLYNLEPAPGYLAAMAVRGRDYELHCWTG